MNVQCRNHSALARQILEMTDDDRLQFVSQKLTERTLSQTIRDLNALMTSGTTDDRDMARQAVQSLGFVNS